MRKTAVILMLAFAIQAAAQTTAKPDPDGRVFHRTNDVMFGAVISTTVGTFTRPWIGLVAAEGAGVANEARYGSHFNAGHLAFISAGALAGYGIAKLAHHWDRKKQ